MRRRTYVICALCVTMVFLLLIYFNQPVLRFLNTVSETLFDGHPDEHHLNTIIYVPSNYTSIQAAVDSATAGDTIYVEAGTYLEKVVVNKNNIKILGEGTNTTIIDGGGAGTVLEVEANNIIVSGFTVRNSGTGISLFKVSNCSLHHNNITLNKFGILLSYSSNCSIYENNVTDNEHNIRLDYSTYSNLTKNTIRSNQYNFGIYGSSLGDFVQEIDKSNTVNGKPIYYVMNAENLTFDSKDYSDAGCFVVVNSSKITIKDLTISCNLFGILLAYTSESAIENVSVIGDKIGIGLYCCPNCTVSGNTAIYNAYQGVKLTYSPQCVIHGNNVTSNTEGIYMIYSNDCTIDANTVKSNEYGMKLDHASNSTFFHNDIIDNTRQTYINDSLENLFDNGYEGNYWSDHPSQDSNHDGICDTPYIVADGTATDRYPLTSLYCGS